MGLATLNEAGKVGFIEIKLLDNSISSAIYNTWNVKACKAKNNGNADGCSETLLLSEGSLSNDVYIVVPTNFIPNNKAFDIILTDGGGDTIDYLSVGYTAQQDNSCTLKYDWNAAVSNSHDYRRMPDGTGDWENAGSGDSGGNTGGGPNEGELGACSVIFPDGIQSHTDGGVLTFNNLAKLTNSPDNILDTTEDIIDGAGWQKNTCDTEDCVASGSSVSFVSYNDFPSGGSVINLSNGDDLTINPGVYESISLNNQNVLTLEAGDYQIETFFSVSDQSTIEVVDGGLARFFVQGSINLGDAIELNTASNAGKFLLYSKNNIVIGNNNIIEAFIYSEGNVTLNNQAQVNGAVTANHVTLISEAQVDFNQDVPDFGDFCDALPAENIALYRFEQTDFTTQIDDTSGNGNHAENLNGGLSTPDGKYCRGFESENWSLDDQIADAFRSSLDVDIDIGIRGAISFWFNSSIDWHQGDERILFDATLEPNIFALEITQDGRLRFAFEDSANDVFIVEEQSAVSRGSNTWYYVTVTWDYSSDTFSLYVDGALVTQQTKSTNGVMPDFARVVFGDNASSYTQSGNSVMPSPVSSRGNYDEVRIYNRVLTQAEIQTDMNDNNGCSVIDHYRIDTRDQQGITCQADEIIIKACADASCSNTYPDAVDVKLLINSVEHKTVTVSGVDGTTTTYPHTTVGNAALSLDQTYKCTNTLATTPCNVTFKDSGFIISDIPMQISGKSSAEGFNSTALSLRAVEKNTTTGVCDNVFPDNTDVAVNLSYTCAGGDCKDLLSLSNNGNSYNLSDTASAKDLYFSNNSTANFTLKYPHAAKFILNAQKDVEVTDSDNNTIIKDFSASSNAFVERPFAFKLDFLSDTNSANAFAQDGSSNPDASKSAFKKAGETFKLTATAVQWQNGQDNSPIDGIPDDFSAINSNQTAENFSDGPLTIIDALLLPKVSDGGVEGTLATELSNSFVNSIITNEYNYSEVGIIKLSANLFDGDYLGAGDILGEVTNVGRFTPAYFTQTVESHGSLNAYHYGTCSPITNDWAYAGQTRERSGSAVGAISYTDYLAPIIHISAYNLGKAITQNYTATGFMKLPASGITIPAPVEDNATARLFPTVVDEKVFISPSMSVGDEPIASATKGIVSYAFNILDHFIYEHNKHSKLPPFSASIPFLITEVEDTDLVRLYDGSDTNITATEKVITQGVEVRFGRWLLENSYGPETSPLPVTMFAQHFDGTSFINNAKENCLIPIVGSKVITGDIGDAGLNLWDYRLVDLDASDNLLPSHTAATVENKSFMAGLYQWLIFSAPGGNKQGSLNVEYQVPPWLQYDWNNDTNFTNNPSAKLTFGIFRGNDRIIYQREIEK